MTCKEQVDESGTLNKKVGLKEYWTCKTCREWNNILAKAFKNVDEGVVEAFKKQGLEGKNNSGRNSRLLVSRGWLKSWCNGMWNRRLPT